jgi:hypothetical protein
MKITRDFKRDKRRDGNRTWTENEEPWGEV